MRQRLASGVRFAAAALAAFAAGCGHPPLTAYATPQPILLGPVRRLPGAVPSAGRDPDNLQSGRFTASANDSISVVSTPVGNGGTYTSSTQAYSLTSVLDAAAADAVQGDAQGRLEAREVECSSVVVYALFYFFAEEQCTLSGRTERPRPPPKEPSAATSAAESAPAR